MLKIKAISSRSSFPIDKYELISWIYATDVGWVHAETKTKAKSTKEPVVSHRIQLLRTLEALQVRSDFYRNVINHTHGYESFRHTVDTGGRQATLEHIERNSPGGKASRETVFYMDFYLHAVSSSAVDWLERGMTCSPEQFVNWCLTAMPEALRPYLAVGFD